MSIIEIAAKSGVDEVQLDYIRFPTQGKQSQIQLYYQKRDNIAVSLVVGNISNTFCHALNNYRKEYDLPRDYIGI